MIREERTSERCELYLRTVLETIDDWLHPDYSQEGNFVLLNSSDVSFHVIPCYMVCYLQSRG